MEPFLVLFSSLKVDIQTVDVILGNFLVPIGLLSCEHLALDKRASDNADEHHDKDLITKTSHSKNTDASSGLP